MRGVTSGRLDAFTGERFDRAAHRRDDAGWLELAIANPDSRFVLFQNGRTRIDGLAEGAPRAHYADRPDGSFNWVFLGLKEGAAIFAAEMPASGGEDLTDLRSLTGALPASDATVLATARGMLYWRAHNAFCARCGGTNQPVRGGYVLRCAACATEHFPRTDPAVIMLVKRGRRVLLGQSHNFPIERNFFSTLAGFVEPGESLEEAVRREVFEEVGVEVDDVEYHSSQPWPFPASLMLGFHAEALSETIILETAEMRDARWFTKAEIEDRKALGFNLPPHGSIARRLIEGWLNSTT